jgi:hypothetical protein
MDEYLAPQFIGGFSRAIRDVEYVRQMTDELKKNLFRNVCSVLTLQQRSLIFCTVMKRAQ